MHLCSLKAHISAVFWGDRVHLTFSQSFPVLGTQFSKVGYQKTSFLTNTQSIYYAVNTEQKAVYIECSSVHCYYLSTEINYGYFKNLEVIFISALQILK